MIGKVLFCLNSIFKVRDVSKSANFIEETIMALLLLNFSKIFVVYFYFWLVWPLR